MKEFCKDKLTSEDVAYLIDASTLKIDTTYADVDNLIASSKKYGFGCAFAWPAYSEYLGKALKGTKTAFGTSLSFPSGQEPTIIKVRQAEYFISLGADEVDMVMNVGWLKSRRFKETEDDIRAVRKACGDTSLKVIIEAMLLTDEEITDACKVVVAAGADYAKSGTGFSAAPSTCHHVDVMKAAVGDDIKIKVAGGVRDLATLLKMYKHGANRFGIGLAPSCAIMEEALAYPGIIDIDTIKE